MARKFQPQMATGNDLLEGDVVYFTSTGDWSREIGDAALASHAWAEAFVPDLGWVGFDPANGISPTERYIRTGIGLDYGDAAPVRGVRRGAPGHSLHVHVHVERIAVQQQQQQ